jgi:hypothetical protein
VDIDKESLLRAVEDAAGDPDKDARVKEIIIGAYRSLPLEQRKYALREFVMMEEGNFEFLMEYAPELHREAFPLQ